MGDLEEVRPHTAMLLQHYETSVCELEGVAQAAPLCGTIRMRLCRRSWIVLRKQQFLSKEGREKEVKSSGGSGSSSSASSSTSSRPIQSLISPTCLSSSQSLHTGTLIDSTVHSFDFCAANTF